MKDIWAKNKVSITIVGYGIVFLTIIYFFWIPLLNKIINNSDEIQKKNIEQQIKKDRLSEFPQMEKIWGMYLSSRKELDVILDNKGEVKFIEKLESMAQITNNKITLKIGNSYNAQHPRKVIQTSLKKGAIKKGILDVVPYKSYLMVEINLQGNYQELVNFIDRLENNNYYINIVSLESEKKTVDKNGDKLNNIGTGLFQTTSTIINSNNPSKKVPEKKNVLNTKLNVLVYIKK